MVRLNSRRGPSGEAVVDARGRLSHRELSHRAWALARGLVENGVRPGDSVGVLAGNSAFCAEAFLGIATAGAVFVPYNWRWSTAELVAGVNETAARVVLVEDMFTDAFEAARATGDLDDVRLVVPQGERYESFLRPGGPPPVDIAPSDPLCILFTGGTTGVSKGVVLSHAAALANMCNEVIDCGVGRSATDRGLITTPLFHSAGLLCWFLPHYATGATSVLLHRFDEAEVADVVERERVTNMFMVPNMIRRLMNANAFETPGFRTFFRALHSGAGLLRTSDKLALVEAMPDVSLYFRYGLTEAGPMVTRLRPVDMLREDLQGSIGKEYLLVEAQIQDDEGREVAPDESGEICVRGPSVMSGYFNRPEETAAVFRAGWLRTGDLAVRDREGYFYFRDRAKEMIKSGGENVYSAEIEQVLLTHPGVIEAMVVGTPSTEWDEEVRAIVVARPGHAPTEAELRGFLRARLAAYKVPKRVVFREASQIPRSAVGKALKERLKSDLGW
ncbi:class I adenylate-forming enzyme family protein [Embleya hyalina]|nr:AMP-binding protein [Embleya hyalina]